MTTKQRNDSQPKVTAIVPSLEAKFGRIHPRSGLVPYGPKRPQPTYQVVDGERIRRMTIQEADAEQAARVARATNTAPIDPATLAETPAGASVLAIVIGDATGLRWRGRARSIPQRLWRALTGR